MSPWDRTPRSARTWARTAQAPIPTRFEHCGYFLRSWPGDVFLSHALCLPVLGLGPSIESSVGAPRVGCHQTIVINPFDYCHHPKGGVEAPQPQTGTGIKASRLGASAMQTGCLEPGCTRATPGTRSPIAKPQGVQRDWSLRIRPGIGENPFGFQDRYWAVLDAS